MSSDSLRYAPSPGRFDEVVDADGSTRPTWQAVARALGSFEPAVLRERQLQADRLLDAQGTGHLVHEISLAPDRHGVSAAARSVSHPWRLDPVPFVIEAPEFQRLAEGATQRMRSLEALLADVHGPRRLVADGIVPAPLLHSLVGYRPVGDQPRTGPWLVHYAVDLVRDAVGAWHVVQDLTDSPTGLGYSLLNRTVLARVVPDGLPRWAWRPSTITPTRCATRSPPPRRPACAAPERWCSPPARPTRRTSSTATSPPDSVCTSSRPPMW